MAITTTEPNNGGRVQRGQDVAAEGRRQTDHIHAAEQRGVAAQGRSSRHRRRVCHAQPGGV